MCPQIAPNHDIMLGKNHGWAIMSENTCFIIMIFYECIYSIQISLKSSVKEYAVSLPVIQPRELVLRISSFPITSYTPSLHSRKTVPDSSIAIRTFIDNYNKDWLIGCLGYKSPLEYLAEYEHNKVALATA